MLRGSAEKGQPEDGLICIDERGIVTGFAGDPYCSDCGQPWVPREERLKIVE